MEGFVLWVQTEKCGEAEKNLEAVADGYSNSVNVLMSLVSTRQNHLTSKFYVTCILPQF
jgi:hypothetical protein